MSTATRFVFPRLFRSCYAITTVPSSATSDPGEPAWVGPLTLAEILALYWNTETVAMNGHVLDGFYGPGLTNGAMSEPRKRICALNASGCPTNFIYKNYGTGSGQGFYEIIFENLINTAGGYYLPVSAYFYEDAGRYVFSLNSNVYARGAATLVATYNANIFGKSVPLYLFRYSLGTQPGDPSLTAVASYYSY